MIKSLYEGAKCRILINETITATFPIESGTPQGCALSGCLFNIAIMLLLLKLNLLAAKDKLTPYMFTFQDHLLEAGQTGFIIPTSMSYADDVTNTLLINKEAEDPVQPFIEVLNTYRDFER